MAFVADLALIFSATVLAIVMRDNLEFSQARFIGIGPYVAATLLSAAVVLPLSRIVRTIWRFTVLADYLRIVAAALGIVLGALAIGFVFNRLDGVARALPVMQGILIVVALVGARVVMRLRHSERTRPTMLTMPVAYDQAETVLVVGLTRLTDLYLRSVAEFAPLQVRIAGLLGGKDKHTGTSVHEFPVLGIVEEISDVIKKLEVHGIVVDRIVVALPFERLTASAQQALLHIEKSTALRVDFIAEQLGLGGPRGPSGPQSGESDPDDPMFALDRASLDRLALRPYWATKRVIDVLASAVLLILLTPLIGVVALVVAIDVGFPVPFWQQRPGLSGYPFHLHKFRTMAAAHDSRGRRLGDKQRLSVIGRMLRRTRFDELPQLINILIGDMSFVGPRPLLPVDQPVGYGARLVVRPGLTGWAQVKGGRDISPDDKAALDIWYVHNASLALDFQIILETVRMVVMGEKVSSSAIQRAWEELRKAGLCRQAGPRSSNVASASVPAGSKEAA